MGEKSGNGIATEDAVAFEEILADEALSDDEMLSTVPLRRGTLDRPEAPYPSCDCDRTLNDSEPRPMDRDSRSDSECIVESCELQ